MSIPLSVKAIDKQTARIVLLETQKDVLLAVCKEAKALVEYYGAQHFALDVRKVYEQVDWAIREVEPPPAALPAGERASLIHREEFGLADLVEIDLTDVAVAVEEYVEEYVLGAGLDPDTVDYGWSCTVTVEIKKQKQRKEAHP